MFIDKIDFSIFSKNPFFSKASSQLLQDKIFIKSLPVTTFLSGMCCNLPPRQFNFHSSFCKYNLP